MKSTSPELSSRQEAAASREKEWPREEAVCVVDGAATWSNVPLTDLHRRKNI
jgi:hypothetical protein